MAAETRPSAASGVAVDLAEEFAEDLARTLERPVGDLSELVVEAYLN